MSGAIGLLLAQKMRAEAQYESELQYLKRNPDRDFVEVPFEWQTAQTAKAVRFPSYGWIPKVALRWRREGLILPWAGGGRQGDVFLIAKDFVELLKKTETGISE